MQERRKQRETEFEQRQQEKEKERVEAARAKEKDHEERMAALNAMQQQHIEELQKKIQQKVRIIWIVIRLFMRDIYFYSEIWLETCILQCAIHIFVNSKMRVPVDTRKT